MPLRARKSSTTLLSAILTHHGLVKEVDEGELPAIRTLRKGSRLDWLFHASIPSPLAMTTEAIVVGMAHAIKSYYCCQLFYKWRAVGEGCGLSSVLVVDARFRPEPCILSVI